MPRSVFFIPTASNILWSDKKLALDDTELEDVDNQDKYLKNVGGNLTWIALPIPDISTLTSAEDGFSIVYDHASTSFVMRDQRVPWDPTRDSQIRYWFDLSNESKMTFTGPSSGLDSLSATVTDGSNYNLTGVNSSPTPIQLADVEGGKKALQFNAYSQGLQFPGNLLGDGSTSFMLVMMVKDEDTATWDYYLTKSDGVTGDMLAIRGVQSGGLDYRIEGKFNTGSTTLQSFGLSILCVVYDSDANTLKLYNNGTEFYSGTSVDLSGLNTVKTTIVANTSSSGNTNQSFDGLLYQFAQSSNISDSNRQKFEGYFARLYGLQETLLPGAHPYFTNVPK